MTQKTINNPVTIEGTGLHTNKKSVVKLFPADIDSGILFQRTDLENRPLVKAIEKNTFAFNRSTSIKSGNASISTIEHFMACFTILGIDNILVQVDAEEMPILDGSALPIYNLLNNNLIEQNKEKEFLTIKDDFEYFSGDSYVKVSPYNGFKIDIRVEYPYPIGVQEMTYDQEKDTELVKDIVSARTFVFLSELEFLLKNNLIKGGNFDNALVFADKILTDDQSEYLCKMFNKSNIKVTDYGMLNNTTLRSPKELVCHKLLDMIGDLSLIGKSVKGHFTAYKPGHAVNSGIAKKIIGEE
ncbi:MAG: UDP-3-O-acyl-N-acetylglucosamine deacetylase [Bacteroidales bacterium]|jgi:UDP-3-O-[3-hydroxymyristoyl] N-acetylglucosamine deacetylase/3-hydroxyacyl-[acyl-carrier-protein] dehydratase|nr:UDP-3-O-acyl-N-acetylglucosamine deacetylase [Bacteroidales bacterium]